MVNSQNEDNQVKEKCDAIEEQTVEDNKKEKTIKGSPKKDNESATVRWSTPANLITIIIGILGIIGIFYSGFTYIKKSIEDKIEEEVKPYKEMLAASFIYQGRSPYAAALKLEDVYRIFRNKKIDKDLLTAVVYVFLETAADSDYQEEFVSTVETVISDKLIPLEEKNLHDIGYIFLMTGDLPRAEQFLRQASVRVEKQASDPKRTRAITYWRLSWIYLAKGTPQKAAEYIMKAYSLSPLSFNIDDLKFAKNEDAQKWLDSFPALERILRQNKNLIEDLVTLSRHLHETK